ncbi:MAG: hypothetical protein ACHQK9_21300 [Reyranellales bacterium]
MPYETIQVRKVTPAIGAEISGADQAAVRGADGASHQGACHSRDADAKADRWSVTGTG